MTSLQRVQFRISEVRQRLNDIGAKEAPTDEERSEADKLAKEYDTLEVRFRALVVGDAKGDDGAAGGKGDDGAAGGKGDDGAAADKAAKDLAKLKGKVELRNYLQAAMDSRELAGAEAELNKHLGLLDTAGVQVPWEALAPPELRAERRSGVEERVDAVTSVGSTANLPTENMAPILGRVFQRSVAAFLGVMMPAVGVGQRNYPVMTAGATAEMKAAGAAVDADAATYTVTVIEPSRLTARYVFRVEDLAVVAGLEASLRSDLAMAMSDQLDVQILSGDGTAPNLGGLFDDDGLTAPAEPTAEADVNAYIDLATGQVDGINAYGTEDVRFLIGPQTLRHAAKKFITGTDTTAYDKLRQLSGGVRVSARVPAVASKKQELLATRMNGVAVAPMWPALTLVRDIYSGAAKGEVALTAIALYGFKVVRDNGYKRLKIQVEA